MHHLEALSGDGDPNEGKLALWTHYQSSPAHPNHTEGLMSPVDILNKDFAYVEACLEIINERNHRENNPSPRPSSSAPKKKEGPKKVVSESSLFSPSQSQPRRSPSVGSIEVSDFTTISYTTMKTTEIMHLLTCPENPNQTRHIDSQSEIDKYTTPDENGFSAFNLSANQEENTPQLQEFL